MKKLLILLAIATTSCGALSELDIEARVGVGVNTCVNWDPISRLYYDCYTRLPILRSPYYGPNFYYRPRPIVIIPRQQPRVKSPTRRGGNNSPAPRTPSSGGGKNAQ